MATRPQYRPSFSMEEIEELLTYIPNESPLYAKVYVYHAKANLGLNAASYIAAPKLSLEERLGLPGAKSHSQDRALVYAARLKQREEISPTTLTPEDKYNLLAAKMVEGVITEEEREEGKKLEFELYGMEMGTFDAIDTATITGEMNS